jgi:hypothetical protein
VRRISAGERRDRLARRHHLAAGARAADAAAVAGRLVGLHASDPATVFLSAWARVDGFTTPDLEAAMYDHGTVRKHHAMRRTLFAFPTELLPVVHAACSVGVLARERARLAKDVERAAIAANGRRWLARAERATLQALSAMGSATGAQLSKTVPELGARITIGPGRKWGGEIGVSTRVLTILAASGAIVRGRPSGPWTSSRHVWVPAATPIPAMEESEARVELVRRWLLAFGPATLADLAWWTGLGLTRMRQATAALGVVEVDLDGEPGVVLPDDVDPEPPVAPWAALLPSLDPTTMGWKRRDWYLGEHAPALFDVNGNAGPTVWWHGRVVGGWTQRASGEVVYKLLEDVGADAGTAIEQEAERLHGWLAGTVVKTLFPTPAEDGL